MTTTSFIDRRHVFFLDETGNKNCREFLGALRCCFEIKEATSDGLFYRNQLFQFTVCSAVGIFVFNTSESDYGSISEVIKQVNDFAKEIL